MEYAQLNPDDSYSHQITTHGNIEWDSTHLCPASALTPDEAAFFKVVPLEEVAQPSYNVDTHTCFRDGGELIGGVWKYKWTTTPLSVEQVALNIAARKANLWTQTKAIRDLKVQTGGYTVGGKWYHSDTFSRTQQMGLVMMGASVPPVQWKTMDGSFVTMTQTLAGQIFAAAAAQDQALFANAEAIHAAILASEDPESVDLTAGWPTTFTG